MGKGKSGFKSSGAVTEPSAYVEIGGYLHNDEGKAKVKLYTGEINRPLQIDDAAVTKRLKKVRVTMNVTEDKTPSSQQVYEKNVWMDQTTDDEPSNAGPSGQSSSVSDASPDMPDGTVRPGMDKCDYLKNFYDELADKTNLLMVIACCALALGAVAFVLALLL